MKVPDWYQLLLLAFASFRTWRLIAEDDILERPRRYVTRLSKDWKEGDHLTASYREQVAEFIECPWCLGAWVALAWWGAWEISPHWASVVAVPFALSALVPMANRAVSQS